LLWLGASAAALPTVPAAAIGPIGYSAPVVVDPVRAGGEPSVIYSHNSKDLIYSSHEGTTHIDRTGLVGAGSDAGFTCSGPLEPTPQAACYQNHVWVWTSTDHGQTWTWRDEGVQYTGFSDPDLTEDSGGTIYDTGIDLVNDALFSTSDGGVTWPSGTPQCHQGDRPWLAGGAAGEVFLTTDDQTNNQHILVHSSNSGASCDSTTVSDTGNIPSTCMNPMMGSATCESFSGLGKGLVDPVDGSFIEPARFVYPKTSAEPNGHLNLGISRLDSAARAFSSGGGSFDPIEIVSHTSQYSPFGGAEVLRMDSRENLYFTWDTDDRDPSSMNGCSSTQPNAAGGPAPLPNHIMFVVGRHVGPAQWVWSQPVALEAFGPAKIPGARVLWPWTTVGTPGNVSVVWYQMDQLVDPDCDIAAATGQPAPNVNTFVYEARISNALDPARMAVTVTNVAGRAIHQGGICDSGTTCVVTGQDRRLGDYFTSNTDANGCLLIASGDTTMPDPLTQMPRATSLPIFIAQNSGPSLTGQDCAAPAVATSASPTAAPSPTPPAIPSPSPTSRAAPLPNTGGGTAALPLLILAAGGWLLAGFPARASRPGRSPRARPE
jgi:hypothetical protein